MQVMPSNFSDLGIVDGDNIEENIDGGIKLLKKYIDFYDGNMEMRIIKYYGESGMMSRRSISSYNDLYKMPPEIRKAVPKILQEYRMRKEK